MSSNGIRMNKKRLQRQNDEINNRLSSQLLDTLTSMCDIQRSILVGNVAGGFTETWTIPDANYRCIPCALNSSGGGSESITVDQPGAVNKFIIHLPPLTPVQHKDRIVIEGLIYQVSSIPDPVSIEVLRSVSVFWVEN